MGTEARNIPPDVRVRREHSHELATAPVSPPRDPPALGGPPPAPKLP